MKLKGLLRFGFPNMKPKKRGSVTFETPHKESGREKFGNDYKPQGQALTLINKGKPGEVPGLGGHLTH